MSSEYPKSVRTLANALYQYREMSDEFAYLRDERQEAYLEEALFIHYSSWHAAEIAAAERRGAVRALREAVSDFESSVGIPEFAEESSRDGLHWNDIEEAWDCQGAYMDWLRNRADRIEAGS